jgi:uncharacterized protein (DUF488 family)
MKTILGAVNSSDRAKPVRTENASPDILTIGHTTRSISEFLRLLQAHVVTAVVDVRTLPRSRHNPQFNRENLPTSLAAFGISYRHAPALGGLRRPTPDSFNTGWRNLSFRGYADYMQTPEFAAHLADLIVAARRERIALMCAEAAPWRCHRSLIADALIVHGLRVEEIISRSRRQVHRLTPFARVNGVAITYPPDAVSGKGAV